MQDYSVDVQKLFLEFMMQDSALFVRVQNIFNSENFDKSLRETAKFIFDHVKNYSTLPERQQIKAVTGVDLRDINDINEGHQEWFFEEFESFTRRKELERAIIKSADLLEKGEYDPVETLIKNAVQISLTRDLGTDYFEDPKGRLLSLRDNNGQMSTGWKNLDFALFGGFSRGELELFLGNSGTGKSLFLQNLAVNWVLNGLNGVYITLELSEELCCKRLDSMITDIGSQEIFKDLDNVELKVKMIAKKSGNFHLKYMQPCSTVNEIRAYIKELQIQKDCNIDFICVDYLDLMSPASAKIDAGNLFIKDKLVAEELRHMAKELKLILVSASQFGRCLALDTKVIINGKKTEIKNVKVGDYLESEKAPVKVTEVLPIVKQAVFEIVTKSGKKIKVSSKHRFPTKNGLRSLNDGLKIGDFLRSRDK